MSDVLSLKCLEELTEKSIDVISAIQKVVVWCVECGSNINPVTVNPVNVTPRQHNYQSHL